MSVVKHIEITAESSKSFADAVTTGVEKASESLKGIRSAWVKDQHVIVEHGKVTAYRVNMKLSFQLE